MPGHRSVSSVFFLIMTLELLFLKKFLKTKNNSTVYVGERETQRESIHYLFPSRMPAMDGAGRSHTQVAGIQ